MDFLMNQLEIEDCNSHHKSISQLNSTTSVNFVLYDHRQNKQGTVENRWDRIKLEGRDLLILDIILENPYGWRESA